MDLFTIFATLILLIGVSSAAPYFESHWEVLPSIPNVLRQEHTTVALSDSIYVLAGVIPDNTAIVSTAGLVQRYHIPTKQWHPASSIPLPLNHANAAAVAGKIYVLGGLAPDGTGAWSAVPDCFVYDPATDAWTTLAPMPALQAKGSAAMGVYGSKVYLAGGLRTLVIAENGLQDTVRTVTVYDTVTGAWEELDSLAEGRDHAGAAVVDNMFYILGGRNNGQRNVRDTVFALDLCRPEKGWITLAPMPTPRGGVATGVVGKMVFIFGGEGNLALGSNGVFNETEVYDVKRNKWRKLQPMRLPRHGTSAVGVGRKIYIPGGGTVEGGAGLVDYFDAFEV